MLNKTPSFQTSWVYVKKRAYWPKKLNSEIEDWTTDYLSSLNQSTTGGRITGKQLHQMISNKFEVDCSTRAVYK